MKKTLTMLSLAILLFLFVSNGSAQEEGFSKAALETLEKADEIQRQVEEIRGLKFKVDVPKKLISSEGVRKMLIEETADTDDEYWADGEKELLFWGYVKDEDFDLKTTVIELNTELIAGFYRRDTRELFIVDNGEREASPDAIAETVMVISHELTHALDDQHFNLNTTGARDAEEEDEVDINGDRQLAWTCCMEASATYLGLQQMFAIKGIDIKVLSLSSLIKQGAMTEMMNSPKFKDVPQVLLRIEVLPYWAGTAIMEEILDEGAWQDYNALYKDPPQSTEQILHLEKYFGDTRDYPVKINLDKLEALLGDGWRTISKEVVGEFITRSVFRAFGMASDAEKIAAGWDGDAYLFSENRDTGQLAFFWRSIWDSKEEAAEFAAAMNGVIAAKYEEEERLLFAENNYAFYLTEKGYALVQRDGAQVVVIEGLPASLFEDTYELLWSAPLSVDSRDKDAPEGAEVVPWKERTWVDWTQEEE